MRTAFLLVSLTGVHALLSQKTLEACPTEEQAQQAAQQIVSTYDSDGSVTIDKAEATGFFKVHMGVDEAFINMVWPMLDTNRNDVLEVAEMTAAIKRC